MEPRWIVARFESKCYTCRAIIRSGDVALYFPQTHNVYGKKCGCAEVAEQVRSAFRWTQNIHATKGASE